MPRYALFAGAVALCGLPLYIHLPAFLASEYGITLEALGLLLLMLRLFDFVQDPLLGWLLSKQAHRLNALALLACLVLGLGIVGLFAIPAPSSPILWIAGCLTLAFTGFSLLSILIYADGVERGRVLWSCAGCHMARGWHAAGYHCCLCFAVPFAGEWLSWFCHLRGCCADCGGLWHV